MLRISATKAATATAKLFILGNGFDVAHKLETIYGDFRKFLKKRSLGEINYQPSVGMDQDGGQCVDQTYLAGFLLGIVDGVAGEDWRDFEESLGRLNYTEYIEDYDLFEYDDNPFRAIYAREDISADLKVCVPLLKDCFAQWIDSIDVSAAEKTDFCEYIGEGDVFITFNYTDTLERIYGVPADNVCHIHGCSGSGIVVGPGETENPYSEDSFAYLGAQDKFAELFEELKKDTRGCYIANKKFFDGLKSKDITDVFSIGFSFSHIDNFYIAKICEVLSKRTVWHLTVFDEKRGRNEEIKAIIKECGFRGRFGSLIPELK